MHLAIFVLTILCIMIRSTLISMRMCVDLYKINRWEGLTHSSIQKAFLIFLKFDTHSRVDAADGDDKCFVYVTAAHFLHPYCGPA